MINDVFQDLPAQHVREPLATKQPEERMSTGRRIAELEKVLGTDIGKKAPTGATVIPNHPDLPSDPEEREAYIASRIPETVRVVWYMPDNGRDPDLLGAPVRLW